MIMRREISIVMALLIAVSMFVFQDYMYSSNYDNTELVGSNAVMDNMNRVEYETSADVMDTVYADLGQGINLGNSLDACDWTYFGSAYSKDFQAALIYNTVPWSGWDASQYTYFDNNGNNTITWNISSLNSTVAKADNFSIQIVNHNENLEGTGVTCDVRNFVIKLKDGRTFYDINSFVGRHELTFSNSVTDYIKLDISKYDLNTSDLIGATVSATIEISNFNKDTVGRIAYLEKYWGNPCISEDLIKKIRDGGFKTVRIPVTYFNHISKDGTIDKEFLDRVEQVVDWVLANGMYCIIDVHHDTGNDGWIKASEDNYIINKDMVGYIFIQIAERFKDKDDRLILEGLNEAVNNNTEWFNIPDEDLQVMNMWNQLFVDCVRSTGGKNSDRYLLVNTYAALPTEKCLEAFKMPNDIANDRIFVGIHCYFGQNDIASGFEVINRYRTKYHLVIGEWAFNAQKFDRESYISEFMVQLKSMIIPGMFWDCGDLSTMGIINRDTLEWYSDEVVHLITDK